MGKNTQFLQLVILMLNKPGDSRTRAIRGRVTNVEVPTLLAVKDEQCSRSVNEFDLFINVRNNWQLNVLGKKYNGWE